MRLSCVAITAQKVVQDAEMRDEEMRIEDLQSFQKVYIYIPLRPCMELNSSLPLDFSNKCSTPPALANNGPLTD